MLDQIEPLSGKVLSREHIPAGSDAGLIYFDAGDVLWSRLRPELAKAVVADEPGVGSPELVRLVVSPQRLDAAFLAHHLRSPEFVSYARAFASGTTRPRLSPALLLRYSIPLPPLHEQRRIVSLLDAIERIADRHRNGMAIIEKASRALFVSVVGEPETWNVSAQIQPLRNLVRPATESMHVVNEESRALVEGFRVLRPIDLLKDDLTEQASEDPLERDGSGGPEALADAGAVLVAIEFPSSWSTLPVAVSKSQSRLGNGIRALLPAQSDTPAAYLADALRAASSRILVRVRHASRGLVRLDLNSLLQMPIPIPSADQLQCLLRRREAIRKIAEDARRLRSLIADAQSALARRVFSGEPSRNV
jgi:type I restriction enzyme S subunit